MRIIHFHNGKGGGVLSVIKNLLQYSSNPAIENHVIYTINKDEMSCFQQPDISGAVTAQVFYYSAKWNFYYTCKQLAKLISDEQAILVAHDWIELGMVNQLGLPNPTIQFLHGDYDYYYKLAETHAASVSAFICVSAEISQKLTRLLPHRQDSISYLKLPVPDIAPDSGRKNGNRIVFIGRCEDNKGYHLLPHIATKLQQAGTNFEWHIYGEGSLDKATQSTWPVSIAVQFHGVVTGNDLLNLLPGYDFFVLPTVAEGMPVTVIEVMKAGVLPVVNKLPGGIIELIGNNERGFLVEGNEVERYVHAILFLRNQPERLYTITAAASMFARKEFDPFLNTLAIEHFFLQHAKIRRDRFPEKVYGSRLDKAYLPNSFVYFLRGCFIKKK